MSGWWGWPHEPEVKAAMAAGASQDPWELAEAMDLARGALAELEGQRPVVVEIGCDQGGTLAAWRSLTEWVYGVTLADNSAATGGSGLGLDPHGAVIITGDSHEAATRAALVRELRDGMWSCTRPAITAPCGACDGCRADLGAVAGTVAVLFIDGDHRADGVRADLAMYGPLVRPGGLIMMHDINSVPDGLRPVEVPQVWAEVVPRYETAEIANPEGPSQGWGVIRVREGDRF